MPPRPAPCLRPTLPAGAEVGDGMDVLTFQGWVGQAGGPLMSNIRDLAVIEGLAGPVLASVSGRDGGLVTWSLAGALPAELGRAYFQGTVNGLLDGGLTPLTQAGASWLSVGGQGTTEYAWRVEATAALGTPAWLVPQAAEGIDLGGRRVTISAADDAVGIRSLDAVTGTLIDSMGPDHGLGLLPAD